MSKGTEELPEKLFLDSRKARVEETKKNGDEKFNLKEEAFAIFLDQKTIETMIYQDTQQNYKELINKAVGYAKRSYAARFEAAKILFSHGVVVNDDTINGVINGEIAYIRAQAEYFLWSHIISCPTGLRVMGDNNVHMTTIPLARFIVLHLYNYDLSYEESEYMLIKKSRNVEEGEDASHPVEFDGKTLITGEVSAVSKK
jgi:hypothetical protein